MRPILEIKEKKKNNSAIFLGCGPSINDLDIDFIKDKDVWANNNFIIHDSIVPDFYHLELKEHRNGPTFRKLLKEKENLYKNVNWILNEQRGYLLKSINPKIYENIYLYRKIKVHCLASLTIILQIMAEMKYDRIYFCGVDLKNSNYFWTDNQKYRLPEILNSCKPDERDKNSIHPTGERKIQEWIAEFGKNKKIELINISKKSLLKDYIKNSF